jgi:hypothetical protein
MQEFILNMRKPSDPTLNFESVEKCRNVKNELISGKKLRVPICQTSPYLIGKEDDVL